MSQYNYNKFIEIGYGEMLPEVENVKILDEPLRYPGKLTPEWRAWVTAQQTRNLNILHEHDPITDLTVVNTIIEYDGFKTSVRIYTPAGKGKFPVFMYIHGGAWVFCDLDTHDHDCRYLCVHSECIVISVDYHLAPEKRFPYQIEECMAVLQWISRNADTINGVSDKIFVGGDSAGGNITAGLCIYNRDHIGIKIEKQVLIYPATDLSGNPYYSYERYGVGYGLDKEVDKFSRAYVNIEEDLKNPYASPMLCDDLHGLPPALFISGECDILVDEGLVYAQRLKEADVEVKYFVYNGMPHGFIQAAYKESYEALDVICKEIKQISHSDMGHVKCTYQA